MKKPLLVFSIFVTGCSSLGVSNTTGGAIGGTAAGAGLGAIIGSQTGHAGPGIAIGAAAGALTGALLGDQLDEGVKENQRLSDEASRTRETNAELRRLLEELEKSGADVRSTSRGIVVNLPDVLFDFDRASLTSSARRIVRDIGEVLSNSGNRDIFVEGHTDSVGTSVYNKDLSERRAVSVARELETNGLARNRLVVAGYGEGRPIASNSSDVGRSRNRRVEVVIERDRG